MARAKLIGVGKEGCEFGHLLSKDVKHIEQKIDEVLSNQKELFNHMSNRVPRWVAILFTLLGSLVVGLSIKLIGG